MPFLIRFILQRGLAVSLGLLTFLGINPTIPTGDQITTATEQRQEVVSKILSDVNEQVVNLDKNLLQDLVTPTDKTTSTKKPDIQDADDLNKDATKSSEIKTAPVAPTIIPSQKTNSENLPETTTQQEKPIDIIINTLNDEILPKNQNDLNLANVLVNIICTEKKGNYVTANTGSGVIISANGVVVTNAHVAQYFLLDKSPGDYSCTLYQENIPTYGYVAKLLYISPDWIKDNPEVIISKNPRGTGENDYALLYITKNTNPALSKPKSFDFAKFNTTYTAKIGDSIELAGFPGAPAGIGDLTHSVGLKKDSTQIEDIFTFGNNRIDVVSTGVTPVAARGASGGGLFKDSNLIALIVTTSGSTGNAYINAITTNYINRDLQNDFGKSLNELITSDLDSESEDFWNNYGKALSKIILSEL
jgi:hypothetical protein